jgi:hypothetical protein
MLRNACRIRLIGACAATILVVALVGCGGGGPSSSSSSQTGEETTAADGMKTVLVFNHVPAPSPSVTNLHAGLEEGKLPDGPVVGTVLTDEDCMPDQQGISHCRNVVRLSGGKTIVLRHPHEMHQVPCLAPGEKVLLRRA